MLIFQYFDINKLLLSLHHPLETTFSAHLGSGELIVIVNTWPRFRLSSSSFTISNIFSSETAWPIKAKFYVGPHWVGETKAY